MTCSNHAGKGKLYLIPIAIGDTSVERYLPKENIDILKHLKSYVVENARTTRQYLRSILPQLDISSLNIYEADKHDGYSYPRDEVMERLNAGEDIGLVSEAGCPAVADPGSLVVADCHKVGVQVVPLVGPSSILLSLMASGFSGQYFSFHGYLPFDTDERRHTILNWQKSCQERGETHIFIEAPYRNNKLLKELSDLLNPHQKLCMAVDLTTPNEEIIVKPISDWKKLISSGKSWQKRPAIFLIGK